MARLESVWLPMCKYAMGPVLKWQGARMGRTILRLPEAAGAREGEFGGKGPAVRLLFVGDSTAAGVGVERQEGALAAQSAASVSRRLGRMVTWQVAARSGVTTAGAAKLAAGMALRPADVLVLSVGANDAIRQRSRWTFVRDYRRLLRGLLAATGAQLAVLNGLPPMHLLPATPQPLRWYLGRCAYRLDAAARTLARRRKDREYVSLQWATNVSELAADGFHPGEAQYRVWAEHVADAVVSLLPAV